MPQIDSSFLKNNQNQVSGQVELPESKVILRKSPFMTLNHSLLDSSKNYEDELSQHGQIGHKLYWSSSIITGVGGKPGRKIVSMRKRLKV